QIPPRVGQFSSGQVGQFSSGASSRQSTDREGLFQGFLRHGAEPIAGRVPDLSLWQCLLARSMPNAVRLPDKKIRLPDRSTESAQRTPAATTVSRPLFFARYNATSAA